LTGSDPLLESKLGYSEVRLRNKQPGIAKLVRAAAAMPDVSEIHEHLIKAYIVAGMLAEAAEAADKLTLLFASPETFLRAASIQAQLKQGQQTEDLLSAGLKMFPQSTELRNAYGDLNRTRLKSAVPVS
jgi:hypothetical protein